MLIPLQLFKKGPGRNAEIFSTLENLVYMPPHPGLIYPLHHLIALEQGVK